MAIRKKKSILIVNSVRKLAHNLSEKLSSMFDYSVSVVCSGIDALSHIQDGAHHVIIVDDTIIHSEGEDIFSKIHRAARCPVILMTSAMYAPCTIEFIEQGGYGCIQKDIGVDRIHRMVSGAIGRDGN